MGETNMTDSSPKITVCFERRPDGGLRAYSNDVPGLILSHTDIDGILADVTEALKTILSCKFKASMDVKPLGDIRQALEHNGVVDYHYCPVRMGGDDG